MTEHSPAGLRVLVVEDEMLIAVLIEEMLQGLGCHVVGPVSRLDAALRLAHEEPLDAAILDVRIRGGQVYPVAEELLPRNIPFVLASGYGDWAPREPPRPAALDQAFPAARPEKQVRLLMAKATASTS